MKKKVAMVSHLLLTCLIILYAASSTAMTLPLPMVQQEQSNWCWAASTQAIEDFLGRWNARQCDMANFLLTRLNGYLPDNCCNYSPHYASAICNQGNYLLYAERVGSVQEIMSTMYSTPSSSVGTLPAPACLSINDVKTEVEAGRPFEMRWDWTGGGAHALVGYGINGDLMNWMDPGYWNNQANVSTYEWVCLANNGVSYGPYNYNHTWTETVKPTIAAQPPTPDVKANGSDGTVWVNAGTPINVTVALDPGGYSNANADWWVAAYYAGYFFFLNSSGQWTTDWVPVVQGPLGNLSPVTIFNGALGSGDTITFAFGVDLNMDGSLNSPAYLDYVTINAY